MDPAVKKETGYIAVWVVLLSFVMEAVFLLLGKWSLPVLFGNIGGAAFAILNFFLMAFFNTRTLNRALEEGKPEAAIDHVKAATSFRLLGIVLLCVILIAVLKTDPYATLIPLLFPRIGIIFWPRFNKNRSTEQPGTEGSDLID